MDLGSTREAECPARIVPHAHIPSLVAELKSGGKAQPDQQHASVIPGVQEAGTSVPRFHELRFGKVAAAAEIGQWCWT